MLTKNRSAALQHLLAVAIGLSIGLSMVSMPAHAGAVLDKIRAQGTVHCGAVERPGLAEVDAEGKWRGLEVDLCRAMAAAVLGSPDRIVFGSYESPAEFGRVRSGADDVFFLTGSEIATQNLVSSTLPGPTIFVMRDAVMVAGDSPAQHLSDMAGKGICFMIGSSSEHSLEQHFDDLGKGWFRHPYSEPGEMIDAYAVQRCLGVSGEETELARSRLLNGPARLQSRLLPEAINVFPIVAASSRKDGDWSAVVAWTIATLVDADRPERKWFSGGARSMPVVSRDLGLMPGWQDRVVKATGSYDDLFKANLGSASPYKLERGPNRNQLEGGMLLAPFVE